MSCHSLVRSQAIGAQKNLKKAGFGLIELMVSISIMAIVAAIILVRQETFNSAILLRGQTYDIALDLRQVQLNAVGSSADSSRGAGEFRSVLGMFFDVNAPDEYKIFRDISSNGFYDDTLGSEEEYGIQGRLDPRFEIREIRHGSTVVDEVSIIFVRPNFDARFFTAPGTEILTDSVVEIDIARRGAVGTGPDVVRTLEVTRSGQISVQ